MERVLALSILGLAVLCLTSCGSGGGGGGGESTDQQEPVASVTVSPEQVTLEVGQSQQLTASTQDEAGNVLTGRTVTWSTSDPAIATVSASGVVEGVSVGSATITASSEGQSGSADVSVTPPGPVASVTVAPGGLTLLVGQSQQLTAITRSQAGTVLTGRTVTWSTTDPTIVTVSTSGAAEGVSVGSATITATSEGQSGDAPVSVVVSATFASIVTGGAHSCALTADGAAYCWGRGESGQLGVAPPSTICSLDAGDFPCSLVPVAVDGGLVFEQLAGGGAHTCGLTSDGTAYCWGRNTSGELGDDSTTDRPRRCPSRPRSSLPASTPEGGTPVGSRALVPRTVGAATVAASSATVLRRFVPHPLPSRTATHFS